MKKTLIEQLNADVFAALLAEKEADPRYAPTIDMLFQALKVKTELYELTGLEIHGLAVFAPEIWDGNIHTLTNLFRTQPTTKK
jgi:hypothetical protein